MRTLAVLLVLLILAPSAHARLVWEDDKGFKLETSGWVDNDMFPDWTGVMCGLTIPPNGYFAILKPGALELKINGKWVKDKGIIITDGCPREARAGGDTNAGTCNITNSSACEEQGGRVIMMIKVYKFYPTPSARPTEARWVERKVMYDAPNYR